MSETAEKLKPMLAALSAEDRAELIGYLVELDDSAESTREEWDADWVDEINRRIADYEAGKTKSIPGDEFMKELKEKYG